MLCSQGRLYANLIDSGLEQITAVVTLVGVFRDNPNFKCYQKFLRIAKLILLCTSIALLGRPCTTSQTKPSFP